MRRYFLAATILSIVAGGPLQALAGDREIAEQIIQKLKVQRDAGSLKDFTLDLKVDKGVVLMRGNVREESQKKGVLDVASGIEGITNVVDEITISPSTKPAPTATQTATVIKPRANVTVAPVVEPSSDNFSFKKALEASKAQTSVAPVVRQAVPAEPQVAQAGKPARWQPVGGVEMAAATESSVESDQQITSSIVNALGTAQRQGRLKGFGVDVNTQDGRVFLNGRASSDEHRELITGLARQVPGVTDVVDEIAVYNSTGAAPRPMPTDGSNEPRPLTDYAPNLTPVNVEPLGNMNGTPAMNVSQRTPVQAQAVPYQMQPQGMQMQNASYGGAGYCGPSGTPQSMSPYAGGQGGPRYEQPYLPNYAWPGYAAYPNYAAVSYPQQYSPSAWPYIGPFYPYPQVPLGWRKVSLEWDDGWWMLDFTDK